MRSLTAGFQALKTAFDIGKSLLNLGVSAEISARISEMNERILAAQESAIASREYQSTLLKQIDELEKQIADFEAWDTEKEKYILYDIRTGLVHTDGPAFAYRLKAQGRDGEPVHYICANCFNHRHKSILQQQTLIPGVCDAYICQECSSIIYRTGQPHPEHFGLKPKRPSR